MSLVYRFFIFTLIFGVTVSTEIAQNLAQKDKEKPAETKKEKVKPEKQDSKNLTAEQLAESVILVYGGFDGSAAGRQRLAQIRKTEVETGQTTRFQAAGAPEVATYQKRIIRGEAQDKDRIRMDVRLPQAEYALIFDNTKTFGIINETAFTPRIEADRAFQANIYHGLDALLRYKENGSTLKLVGKDKNMNVEYYILEVTDKQNRTTRFNISAKLYRIQSLEYSMALADGAQPTKFLRKFHEFKGAQGTLVPYRSVLYADGKQVEETTVYTITFGIKVDDGQFQQPNNS